MMISAVAALVQTFWAADAGEPPDGFVQVFGTGAPQVQRCQSDDVERPARPVLVRKSGGGVEIRVDAVRTFDPHSELQARVDRAFRFDHFAGAIRAEPTIRDALRLPTGWLAALDAGRAGGGVWWFGDDREDRPIDDGTDGVNARRLIRVGDRIYAATGRDRGRPEPSRILVIDYEVKAGPHTTAALVIPAAARDLVHHQGMLAAVGAMGPVVIGADAITRHAARTDLIVEGLEDRLLFDPSGHAAAIDDDGVLYVGGRGGFSVFRDLPKTFLFDYYALEEPCRPNAAAD